MPRTAAACLGKNERYVGLALHRLALASDSQSPADWLKLVHAFGAITHITVRRLQASMGKQPPSNHGEGDPEAANRFNTAEQRFVNSARGKKKIQEGADVHADEEAGLAKAEQLGHERAKSEAPASEHPSKR